METPFNTILNLLIESPGNIIYHLALAFAIITSLQAVLISRRSKKDSSSNRMVIGLGMLLLGQVILYISSGLAWQNLIEERIFLPPLDRGIMLFSLVWIIWLWAFPTPAKLGDLITGFLNLGIVLFFLFSYTSWAQANTLQYFNNSWIDRMWEFAEVVLLITGMLTLLFSRPIGWEFGLGMFSLILAGTVAHILHAPSDQDFSGYIRLGQLAAFPLLPTLLYRLGQPSPSTSAPVSTKNTSAAPIPFPRAQERRRYSADPRTIHAWSSLADTSEPDQILSGVARALGHTMLSDICFLIPEMNHDQVILQTGYDLIREEIMPGTALDQKNLPGLTASIQRGKTLIITPNDAPSQDLSAINAALGLQESGGLLFIPLFNSGYPEGGILFLSPYSKRQWNVDDQGYLASDLEAITNIIHKAQHPPAIQDDTGQISAALNVELQKIRQDNQVLLMELSEYRKNEPSSPMRPDRDLDALIALQQESQDQINLLHAENERLQSILAKGNKLPETSKEHSQIEQVLRKSLEDVAMLQNQLAEANARNLILVRDSSQNGPNTENLEVITSIVQEIRQPIASIGGYAELLLSESVGILGTLQRKFLERIEASTERLRSNLDDLVRVTIMSEGPIELLTQSIEFGSIVDGAVADTSAQLREKGIALRVDLPEEMPRIVADRDAIQQIILHLLHNAGAVTPQDSTITLRARIQNEKDDDFLLIQVTDNGGGIRTEDLPRVFSRRYRADKPLIQGLGDTGVGLSIAKTLVEAHNGRIWVDSTLGQGTTISLVLPMHPNLDSAMIK